MILQTVDYKNKCKALYSSGQLYFDNFEEIIKNSKYVWKHADYLKPDSHEYLCVLLREHNIGKYSGDRERYDSSMKKIQSHIKAASIAKINMEEVCLFELVPEFDLVNYFSLREEALGNLLKKVDYREDREILKKAHIVASDISSRKINAQNSLPERIKYDIFGTKTGRFSTEKGSLPILTIKKEERRFIEPNSDLFLELDFNAAEVRTLLSLSGTPQPEQDVHAWNMTQMPPWVSREEAKDKFFAWLYNPSAQDADLSKFYDKGVYKKYWDGNKITTPFGRSIEVDERRALNYLLQSTTSDLVVEAAYKIYCYLKDKKSKISFTMHDSIVLDFDKSEHFLVPEIKKAFNNTRLGQFVSSASVGKNYGTMRALEI